MNHNLVTDRPTFVTHLECSISGETYDADTLQGLSRAGRPLLVRYDLAGIKAALSRDELDARDTDMWRWRELLPVRGTENIVSLGEIETPLIAIPASGGPRVLVKDEGRLPTGSFKARGLVMAVAMAKELGSSGSPCRPTEMRAPLLLPTPAVVASKRSSSARMTRLK